LSVSSALPETQRRILVRFEDLLRSRAVDMGLIAERDRGRIRERHIEDSLRALACIQMGDREIVDLGSGAGLPGLPVAIAMPDREVTVVESRRKRAAFLELAVDELELTNVSVHAGRAEEVTAQADVCLARALAPPLEAWVLAGKILAPGGRLVYFAGRDWDLKASHDALRRAGAFAEICAPKQFTWQGPLVIIGRFSSTDGSQSYEPKHF